MAKILKWQSAPDPHQLLAEAIDALARGQLVGVPTETVYGIAANAWMADGVVRLQLGKGRAEHKPLTLALGSTQEALDWVPAVAPLGRRLARRCWPGPLTLVFRMGFAGGPVERLPQSVRRRICPGDTLGLRVPDHPAAREILSLAAAPLVLTSANRSGEPAATTAEEVMTAVGDDLAFVVDGGPSRYGRASTVALIDDSCWSILREGVLSERELSENAACRILFVCTGNSCRSPMAAALCQKHLAKRLGCRTEDLLRRGFFVHSAGLAAQTGNSATPQAVEAAGERGAELANHQTQPLTESLVQGADHLIVMTRSHLLAIEARFAGAGRAARLLSPRGMDVSDPIGCDLQVYRQCAREIDESLEALIPELVR
jgi:tRNA threonylcarbamoyl adenosine modification protein (Sua5/YciO/YrdC/YwlC family)